MASTILGSAAFCAGASARARSQIFHTALVPASCDMTTVQTVSSPGLQSAFIVSGLKQADAVGEYTPCGRHTHAGAPADTCDMRKCERQYRALALSLFRCNKVQHMLDAYVHVHHEITNCIRCRGAALHCRAD